MAPVRSGRDAALKPLFQMVSTAASNTSFLPNSGGRSGFVAGKVSTILTLAYLDRPAQ